METTKKDVSEVIIELLLSDYGRGFIAGMAKTLEIIEKKAESKDSTSEDG